MNYKEYYSNNNYFEKSINNRFLFFGNIWKIQKNNYTLQKNYTLTRTYDRIIAIREKYMDNFEVLQKAII